MKTALFVVVALCVLAAATRGQKQSQVVYVPTYIYKAEAFLDFDENQKIIYSSGLIDGYFASSFFGASEDSVRALNTCAKGMDAKQLAAIFSKYLKDNPERWQNPMSVEAFNALNRVCPGVLRIVGRN